ncbi:hypothetical protein J2X56_001174 [Herbaspirillum sp. 1173]|nr:hypothetical protein [Herbaspirillum sp. 1173]MDR6739188.1 hypothetical protein [Herbaspirillum sp. 1173]
MRLFIAIALMTGSLSARALDPVTYELMKPAASDQEPESLMTQFMRWMG